MKVRPLFLALCCLATPSISDDYSANDVSILLEAPFEATDARLPLPKSSFSDALAARIGKAIDTLNKLDNDPIPEIDTELLLTDRADLHVASLRIDPGAPGLHPSFAAFGRALQIRLVVQPVDMDAAQPVKDEGLHLVYQFGTSDSGETGCIVRVMPSEADMDAFEAALDDLSALKAKMLDLGIDTSDAPLGVHPAFADPEAADILVAELEAFLLEHLGESHLTAVSIAGIPPSAPEPWVFAAFNLGEDGSVRPFPSPALPQVKGGPGEVQDNILQMLSFLPGADQQVVPTPANRNLLPVDCLFNKVLAQINLPTPAPAEGVSTATLFDEVANTPDRAAEVGEAIADATRSHFFNTDCVSCHTETRREMDAASDPKAAGARIAEAERIAVADLPTDPAGRFDAWNIRAFGWFPGFNQDTLRAQATVVRRTARETEEVLACLNEGDWRDLDRACIAHEEVRIDPQGWSDETRRLFYHTSQGGRIIPASWFNALPSPDGRSRFAATEHLQSYGLLPSDADAHNPDGWPIGLTRTATEAGDYVSLNCAACHTANVVAGDVVLRLDGAPAAFDFDTFAGDLAKMVSDTVQMTRDAEGNPVPTPAFQAFLVALAPEMPEVRTNPQETMARILFEAADFSGRMALRHPMYPSGPGRVDALTQITNAITVKDLGIPNNFAVPKAPTSYPPLWLADKLEYVQYNLAAADPLGRNLGQALGVFGTVMFDGDHRFTSTADITALQDYETWIQMLEVPEWPEDLLGPIDPDLAEEGRDLFSVHCDSCHNAPEFRMTDPKDNLQGDPFIAVSATDISEVGTDGTYVNAFTGRWAQTGTLAGVQRASNAKSVHWNQPLGC